MNRRSLGVFVLFVLLPDNATAVPTDHGAGVRSAEGVHRPRAAARPVIPQMEGATAGDASFPNVVQVVLGSSGCSGMVLGAADGKAPSVVVLAAHCIKSTARGEIRFPDGRRAAVECALHASYTRNRQSALDVAACAIEESDRETVRAVTASGPRACLAGGNVDPSRREKIEICGYGRPHLGRQRCMEHRFLRPHPFEDGEMYEFDTSDRRANSGDSGAAYFRRAADGTWLVHAVHSGTYKDSPSHNVAASTTSPFANRFFEGFLKRFPSTSLCREKESDRPSPKLPSPDLPSPKLPGGDPPARGKVLVSDVERDSLAAKLGLRVADEIVSLGGHAPAHGEDLAARVKSELAKGPRHVLEIAVRRRGHRQTLRAYVGGAPRLGITVKTSGGDGPPADTPVPTRAPDAPPPPRSDAPSPFALPVFRVVPGSLAAQAGVQQGDRIVSVGGRTVADGDALEEAVTAMLKARVGTGDAVLVTERNGARRSVPLAVTPERHRDCVEKKVCRLGVDVPAWAEVVTVVPGTLAARAGVQPGDRIVSLGDTPVTGVASLGRAVEAMLRARPGAGDPVLVAVRDGAPRSIPLAVTAERRDACVRRNVCQLGVQVPASVAVPSPPARPQPPRE